jgi:hypothetical protein
MFKKKIALIKEKIQGNVNGEAKGKFKETVPEVGSKNEKKKMENLIVFAIILIVTIVAINYIWSRR